MTIPITPPPYFTPFSITDSSGRIVTNPIWMRWIEALKNNVNNMVAITTGAIKPTYPAGIVGNATGNPVTAGSIGETHTTGEVTYGSLTTATPANVTSLALTEGQWIVTAGITLNIAATTSVTSWAGGLNTVTGTLPTGTYTAGESFTTAEVGTSKNAAIPSRIYNIGSGGATIYLVSTCNFTISTISAVGQIAAVRNA